MTEFFSKSSEPSRHDARIREVLQRNRSTIVRLADQFSQGAYSASRKPREEPKPEGLIIHTGAGSRRTEVPEPYVKLAINGRVLVVDGASARQMLHLGDVRRAGGESRFRLATRDNGFFSPVDADVSDALADLDGRVIGGAFPEPMFLAEIARRLGLAEAAGE